MGATERAVGAGVDPSMRLGAVVGSGTSGHGGTRDGVRWGHDVGSIADRGLSPRE